MTRVAIALAALLLGQSNPTTQGSPSPSSNAVIVVLKNPSDGGGIVVQIDAGPSTFSTDQLEYVCCGTSFTAFPAALANRTSIAIQNYGPNAVVWGPDGGLTILNGTQLNASSSSTANASASLPLGCVSAVAQTDGGCTAIQETM